MNQVILIGRVGKDPEIRNAGQSKVATFSVATSRKNGKGQNDYETTWHNIKLWGKTAELAHENIRKGDEVFIQGRITVESWDSNGQKQYRTLVTGEMIRITKQNNNGGDGEY